MRKPKNKSARKRAAAGRRSRPGTGPAMQYVVSKAVLEQIAAALNPSPQQQLERALGHLAFTFMERVFSGKGFGPFVGKPFPNAKHLLRPVNSHAQDEVRGRGMDDSDDDNNVIKLSDYKRDHP